MSTLPGIAVDTYPDPGAAATGAAAVIAAAARDAVAARGLFTVALSGGRTPAQMLAALAHEDVPWDRLRVFQVDERIAAAGDAARNLGMLERALLDTGLLPRERLHPMPVEATDLDAAVVRYASVLSDAAGVPPVLDLVHLGLGDDGHTASLVPGDPALSVDSQQVCTTLAYRGHRRMTLTFPAIDRARRRLWLATGEDKGTMLARLHAGDASIPAGRVSRVASRIVCDAAAARAAGLASRR